MALPPSGMGAEFFLSSSAWEELRDEFSRILDAEECVLVLGVSLSSEEAAGDERAEHGVQTPFTRAVAEKSREVAGAFGAEAHLHLHPNSGTVTYVMKVGAEDVVEKFRGVLEAMNGCEGCFVTGVEGEVRVGEELAALVFGSSAKAVFILPSADGRRLKAVEALLSV